MLTYALRRVLATIPVLLAATILTFVLVDRTTDPIAELRTRQPPVAEQTIEATRTQLYLDRPLPERYWLWLTGIGDTHGDVGLLRGRWGPSVRGQDIGAELGGRFLVTLRLVGAAALLTIALAVATGVVGAARRRSALDRLLSGAAYLTVAVPTFWMAAVVRQGGVWANERVGHRVLWTLGATSSGYDQLGWWGKVGDVAGHLVLPTTALVVAGYALISRQQRAAMLEALDGDHVLLARAKGLRERVVLRHHALRTALGPTVTLSALLVSELLAGSVIIEQIFRWRGLGTYLLESIAAADAYAVLGYLVVVGLIVSLTNLAADLLQARLDPRVRDA